MAIATLLVGCSSGVPSTPPPEIGTPAVETSAEPQEETREPTEPSPEGFALDRELESYEEVADQWIQGGQDFWVRNGQGCTAVRPKAHEDKLTASIEACVRDHGTTRVRCRQEMTVEDNVLSFGGNYCEQENADGSGKGSGARPFDRPSWVAREVRGDVVELGPGYRLWIEPARVVRQTSPCREGTVLEARRALEAEGVADVERELYARLRVFDGKQACDHGEGLQLISRDVSHRGHGDRAVLGQTLDTPVDCSMPCPPSEQRDEIRGRNALLEGRRFFRVDEAPSAFVYLSKAACESADDPPLVSEPCDLLD